MPLRAPDPGTFEQLLEEVHVDAKTLLRLSRYPATELWWSHDAYRFDGPPKGAPDAFGTCYAAPLLATAFAESVIHECSWFKNDRYEVPAADLKSRHIVTFRLRRPTRPQLVLADFTGGALKRLGLNNDISSGDNYDVSRAWAKAVSEADPKWDGIQYVSRQHNDQVADALFERSGLKRNRTRLLDGKTLDDLCDLFKVTSV